jgi:hypothetical protein
MGLRQIMGMYRIPSPQIRFFDRKELLRLIKESRFPDQTGVEEVDHSQMKSAQESMMNWLLQRGQFRADHHASFIEAMDAMATYEHLWSPFGGLSRAVVG